MIADRQKARPSLDKALSVVTPVTVELAGPRSTAKLTSLPKAPASSTDRVWWRCPGCDFTLLHRNGDHLHNQALYKRKANHLKYVHSAPAEPCPRGDLLAVTNQVESRVANQTKSYVNALPWLRKKNWPFAHKMAGVLQRIPCSGPKKTQLTLALPVKSTFGPLTFCDILVRHGRAVSTMGCWPS